LGKGDGQYQEDIKFSVQRQHLRAHFVAALADSFQATASQVDRIQSIDISARG